MAGRGGSEQLRQFERPLQELLEQHLELKDEPLHLAVAFTPARDPNDIFLLEVVGGWSQSISPDKELFEVVYLPESGFPMAADQKLHLVLTTPEELATALEEDWLSSREIVDAVRRGDFKVLHEDPLGKKALKQLKAVGRHAAGAKRG